MVDKAQIQIQFIEMRDANTGDVFAAFKQEGGGQDHSVRDFEVSSKFTNIDRSIPTHTNRSERLVHVLNKIHVEITGDAIVSDLPNEKCHMPCAWPEKANEMMRSAETSTTFFGYSFECGWSQGGMA